jgi:aspartyl protease
MSLPAEAARAQTGTNATSVPPASVTVPFDLLRGHIVMSARANGSRTVALMLDTGYTINMLSAEVVESLQLPRAGKITIVGIAGERDAEVFQGPTFDFTGLSYMPRRVATFDTDSRPRRRREDGILGSGFFRRFVVEIDFKAKNVRLHEPNGYQYTGPGEIIPLNLRRDTPSVDAFIQLPDRPPITGRFEIDLGCDGGLCLGHEFVERHKLIEAASETESSSRRGVGGSARTASGHLPQLKLGGLTINQPPANFFLEGSPVDGDRAGHIGIQVLREFRVVLDYSRRRMILATYATARGVEPATQNPAAPSADNQKQE